MRATDGLAIGREQKVARYSPASALVVKQYEGRVRLMFNRIFG
jgi:hypothetical protein